MGLITDCGYGDGHGDGSGDGCGYGYGYGSGGGYGYGSGSSYGDGYGYGYGSGYGSGGGYGSGSGDGDGYWSIDADRPLLAWHVVPPDGRLRYLHHGERPEVAPGLTLSCEPEEVVLCQSGLHASIDLDDALNYRTGVVCRVEVWGRVQFGADKLAAQHRRVVAVYESLIRDAEATLGEANAEEE